MKQQSKRGYAAVLVLIACVVGVLDLGPARAQAPLPTVADPNLLVRTIVAGLSQPTSMAFTGSGEFLVLEKATGMVKHVINGAVVGTVLDLPVNSASERGLLGIALHPNFAENRWVYLFWTCSALVSTDSLVPSANGCRDLNDGGADATDATDLLAVPLLGNRIDRFVWDGAALRFDRRIIELRSFQNDPSNGAARGNHNGGVIRFGGDQKLYVMFGDNGRRGQTQNLMSGPFEEDGDDQFGGPGPDNAHLTGVILRLNDDGSAPSDNPFFEAGSLLDSERGNNVQRIFAYGVRNSFGMAFDPQSGELWDQQNGDDSFDEINRVEPGANLGWSQVMGPITRVAEFKRIELSLAPFDLQQQRWRPERIADTLEEAAARLVMLPGAKYVDPRLSWRYAVAPAAIGFLNSSALGREYEGDLFVGASRPTLQDGYLFRLELTGTRRDLETSDARLFDRVADNHAKFDITESDSLQFGAGFGVGTDIQTGPNGNLYVVSLSHGAVYEISRRH